MNKRIFAGIAMLLCLCVLAGCKAPDTVNTEGFITFLDNENFVPGVGQGDFMDQLGKYSYEGTPLSEQLSGYFYDGVGGGGYQCLGKNFGMENDFHADDEQDVATYTNRFYTCVPLEGLQLPYGIDFTDTLDTVLSKLGISKAAAELTKDVRLYQNGYQEIKWEKGSDEAYSGTLLFTQEYGIAKADGRPSKVIRTVAFSFLSETNQLGKAEISVVESYPYF